METGEMGDSRGVSDHESEKGGEEAVAPPETLHMCMVTVKTEMY